MEPEGAGHAPQTSKGPTLTFIVEKKLPAGWIKIGFHERSVSRPQQCRHSKHLHP